MAKKESNTKTFNATDENSILLSAEIQKNDGKDFGTFVANNGFTSEQLQTIAAKRNIKLDIISSVPTDFNGSIILAQSDKCMSGLIEEINKSGGNLQPPDPEKPHFNPWKWRAITSLVGQSLQIASSFSAVDNSPDVAAMAGFGSLNLLANACNWTFGSQHNPDENQLKFLKAQFNQSIGKLVDDPAKLPSVDSDATKSRIAEYPTLSFAEQAYKVAQHYSVSVGEIATRAAGTFALSYTIDKWGEMAGLVAQGKFMEAHHVGKNTNQVTYNAGLATLFGKGLSILAKEEDPFNPKEKNVIDIFREKIAFKASSVIEGGAAAYMMADRLNMVDKDAPKKAINVLGLQTDFDWVGATGNAIFIGGYGIRLTAPYGSLDVDMKHLYAHISDCLAQIDRKLLPEVLLASAGSIKQHFAEDKITFTEIYSGIAEDLLNHHGIDVAMWAKVNQNMAKATSENPMHKILEAQMIGVTEEKSQQMLNIS